MLIVNFFRIFCLLKYIYLFLFNCTGLKVRFSFENCPPPMNSPHSLIMSRDAQTKKKEPSVYLVLENRYNKKNISLSPSSSPLLLVIL